MVKKQKPWPREWLKEAWRRGAVYGRSRKNIGGEEKMEDFIEEQRVISRLINNPLEAIEDVKFMVLLLSRANNKKAKTLLRLTINVILERLEEITYIGGEEG